MMLGQRRRRWANIKTSLFQFVVFAGKLLLRDAASEMFLVHSDAAPDGCDTDRLW